MRIYSNATSPQVTLRHVAACVEGFRTSLEKEKLKPACLQHQISTAAQKEGGLQPRKNANVKAEGPG